MRLFILLSTFLNSSTGTTMKTIYKRSIALLMYCGLLACSTTTDVMADKKITQIFLAGDSTMAIKDPKDFPETGWGVPFATFFNDSVKVVNLAVNGRSTRTFIEEGRWQALIKDLQPGDYVFIQFGHNDQSEHKVDRYTTPQQYRANLNRFIDEVESKQANPILLTPVVRRHFDENGKLKQTHPYADIVRDIAGKRPEVVFIDAEKITHDYFEKMGDEESKLRFMHLEAGLHPNYPIGMMDDTHYNELGAREVAQLILLDLKSRKHPLTDMLREADPKHLQQ